MAERYAEQFHQDLLHCLNDAKANYATIHLSGPHVDDEGGVLHSLTLEIVHTDARSADAFARAVKKLIDRFCIPPDCWIKAPQIQRCFL